jgi:hypothetical protein
MVPLKSRLTESLILASTRDFQEKRKQNQLSSIPYFFGCHTDSYAAAVDPI